MSIYDKEYLADVPCWNCRSVGSVEWRIKLFYCRTCGESTDMVPVRLRNGDNYVKGWRGTGLAL